MPPQCLQRLAACRSVRQTPRLGGLGSGFSRRVASRGMVHTPPAQARRGAAAGLGATPYRCRWGARPPRGVRHGRARQRIPTARRHLQARRARAPSQWSAQVSTDARARRERRRRAGHAAGHRPQSCAVLLAAGRPRRCRVWAGRQRRRQRGARAAADACTAAGQLRAARAAGLPRPHMPAVLLGSHCRRRQRRQRPAGKPLVHQC